MEGSSIIGWSGGALFASVPIVVQAEDNDGSQRMMTAPVHAVAVAGAAGIPFLLS
ncbi:MAG: hypothetical protein SGJ16_04375 [Nitrospirota bacterium]|nr:hypothetical protein [Nitrospirota bacterium]